MSKQTKAPRKKEKKASQFSEVMGRLRRNKLAMVSLAVIILIILAAIFANYVAPYDYAKQDMHNRFLYPSLQHLCGTDNFGRDIFSRIIYGARYSLVVSVIAVAIAVVGGAILGATSGYFGGLYDTIVQRIIDILMAIPSFLLAVVISASLGTGIMSSALAIAVGMMSVFERIMRSSVLQIRDQEFIEAAKVTGASTARIIFHEIIPNALSPIIVNATLCISSAIIAISGLSFIGLGIPAPTPEWGTLLSAGRDYIRDFWPMVTFPGVAIVITIIAFNLLGDGLRDAMDPRLKQ
ncbi:MAG: ABC transporter permease [Oscillospiraceae bacterium]|nr:ABC transporter permease [Oscillospiraceae bacterium]